MTKTDVTRCYHSYGLAFIVSYRQMPTINHNYDFSASLAYIVNSISYDPIKENESRNDCY